MSRFVGNPVESTAPTAVSTLETPWFDRAPWPDEDPMNPLVRIERGLLARLVVLVLWGSAGLCGIAILLGRSAPGSAAEGQPRRTWEFAPAGINECGLSQARGMPHVLDPQTGAVAPCRLPDARDLLLLGFSPWRDADGQHHVMALCRHAPGKRGEGEDGADGTFALRRYSYPAGRILQEFPLEVATRGQVCWFPDRSDRILFASGDFTLCCYDLGAGTAGRSTASAGRLRALRWECTPPGVGRVLFQDPCWPDGPALGGRLIVSAFVGEGSTEPYAGPHLWWLQVDTDRATIVAAGRLAVDDGKEPTPANEEERMPCVHATPDGQLLLAYLGRAGKHSVQDLWVAPISFDISSRAPRVLRSTRRKLAEGCVGMTLAFSPDGRAIHVTTRKATHPLGVWGGLSSHAVD